MENRGNGYYECNYGRFDAALVYDGEMVARTDADVVIGYDLRHEKEINDWAAEYDYPVEWKNV